MEKQILISESEYNKLLEDSENYNSSFVFVYSTHVKYGDSGSCQIIKTNNEQLIHLMNIISDLEILLDSKDSEIKSIRKKINRHNASGWINRLFNILDV